ncbi:pentapeptide repeat-containing protein [Leptothoe sp. EHU-05/26/07-4]
MANAEHVERFNRGVKSWNQWRREHSRIAPDLSGTDLRAADISRVNFSNTDLSKAIVSKVNLSRANLKGADLCGTDLSETNLKEADLREAYLRETILRGACLRSAYLRESKLLGANIAEADISRADLYGASLYRVNLFGASLYKANLYGAKVFDTDLSKAIFTGACIEDWNINSSTSFDGAICEYVYLKANQQERRPREGIFKPGEFTALFQQAVDTVDLIFTDGIDWQAFFQSFQDLRSQYTDENLSIQGIEKKQGEAFVIRLAMSPESDKAEIESRAKELYAFQIKVFEAQYEERLRLQGQHLEDARQTIEIERRDKASLMAVMSTMASTQLGPKYDMRGAQFAGGFVETVQGSQSGGTINHHHYHHAPNTEDITRLLTALRDQAQTFPTEQKDEVLDILEALQDDLAKPKLDQPRIGRRLKKLVTLDATTSGDLTTFTANVIELTEALGIPIEQVQLQVSGNS